MIGHNRVSLSGSLIVEVGDRDIARYLETFLQIEIFGISGGRNISEMSLRETSPEIKEIRNT